MTRVRILSDMHGHPLILERNVTKEECPWLEEDLPIGSTVYFYDGETYGCLSSTGIAVMLRSGGPFVEIPRDAVFTGQKKRWTGRMP